jgi:hypothetical protein
MSKSQTEGMAMNSGEERSRLFTANLERIEFLYERCIQDRVDRPVIFLLDIRDDVGRLLAEGLSSKEDVASHLQLASRDEVDYCFLQPLAMTAARVLVSEWSSGGTVMLDDNFGSGEFPVVVVSSGGVLWLRHRIP